MKKINLRIILLLALMAVVSCDEPDTVVTNIVHTDGSVTRKIVIRYSNKGLKKSDIQVPFDNTWTVTDSLEVGVKGDSTWIRRAEKLFKNDNEINSGYKNDSSTNGKIPREAHFSKRFKWFNTEYRFSEIIGKQIVNGYSVTDFLNEEELKYFYSPDYIIYNMENGADSLKYKVLSDSLNKKTDHWAIKNIASLWIKEFSRLTAGKSEPGLSVMSLNANLDHMVKIIEKTDMKFDSLWEKGVLLKEFIGEKDAVKFKTEGDSALDLAFKRYLFDFISYSERIVMPGKLMGTNGYIDSTRNLLWPVKSDFFVTDNYEMWAESKTPNIWAWVVSGFFLVFVFAGIILKRKNPARATGFKP
jgi:hypothetical protein